MRICVRVDEIKRSFGGDAQREFERTNLKLSSRRLPSDLKMFY